MSKQSALIVVLAVVVVSALILSRTKPGIRNQKQVPETQVGLDSVDSAGKAAPDFQLPTLDGKQLKLSDYRGKAVLLNFWATWCGPCKIEMPWFVELQKKYRDKGFEVFGVAMESSPDDTAEFAKRIGLNYTIVMGNDAVADLYGGLNGLPISFYIDRDGRIVAKSLGLTGRDEIEENIRKALQVPFQRPTTPAFLSEDR